MKTFPKTNKLVDEINKAMMFLTDFQDGNFKSGDAFYAKEISKSFIKVDAEEVRTEIEENLLDEHDQKTIDRAKMILNRVELETLDVKVFREILSIEHHEEIKLPSNIWDCYSFLFFTCMDVRNKYYEILERYGLKNNYPKNGFLCPYELEDVHEEDITADKQVKPQEPAKAIISKTDALNEVNNEVNTCKYRCTETLPLKKIYKYLIETETIKNDISETQFINDCHNADFSKEYATGKRAKMCYVATVLCDYYVPNEGINDDWRTAITKSMGVDKNYIKGRNWGDFFADNFPLKRKN